MGSVILRRGWPGTLRHNAQLDPSHGNSAEAARRATGEGNAVIGVDHQRQTILVKGCLEDGVHVQRIGLRHDVAAQQIAAVRVGDGERIATGAVGGAEPAFEIGAPSLIDCLDRGERLLERRRAYPRLPPMRKSGALQHLPDGAYRGPRHVGMRGGQLHPQFARAPMPTLPRRNDVRLGLLANLVRPAMRRTAPIRQPSYPFRRMPRQPLIHRLARYPV